MHSRRFTATAWILRLVVVVILFQTLFFKFTGAPESVYIFTRLGAEPWGRIGSGLLELAAGLLILWPRRTALGAGLAVLLMAGAIGSHLTRLGIVVMDDGGMLFGLAWVVLIASAGLLWMHRRQLESLR